MNEQIKEFSNQAGLVASATYVRGPDAIWLREYNKKFAELLIKECALIIQDFVDHRLPASEYPKRLKINCGVK